MTEPTPRPPHKTGRTDAARRAPGRSTSARHPRQRAAAAPAAVLTDQPQPKRSVLLVGVRYVLPVVVVIIGGVIMSFGSEPDLEGGASVVSAGLAVYFLNWLFRFGAKGDSEREREDAARDYFDRHGRWPD